jgi:hypothetical protein
VLITTGTCVMLPSALPAANAVEEPEPIRGQGYHIVFEDNFDTLNTEVWATHPPYLGEQPAGAVVVGDGTLKLTSRDLDNYPELHVSTLGQRTGHAPRNYPKATMFQQGYFEARMRYTVR